MISYGLLEQTTKLCSISLNNYVRSKNITVINELKAKGLINDDAYNKAINIINQDFCDSVNSTLNYKHNT